MLVRALLGAGGRGRADPDGRRRVRRARRAEPEPRGAEPEPRGPEPGAKFGSNSELGRIFT